MWRHKGLSHHASAVRDVVCFFFGRSSGYEIVHSHFPPLARRSSLIGARASASLGLDTSKASALKPRLGALQAPAPCEAGMRAHRGSFPITPSRPSSTPSLFFFFFFIAEPAESFSSRLPESSSARQSDVAGVRSRRWARVGDGKWGKEVSCRAG